MWSDDDRARLSAQHNFQMSDEVALITGAGGHHGAFRRSPLGKGYAVYGLMPAGPPLNRELV